MRQHVLTVAVVIFGFLTFLAVSNQSWELGLGIYLGVGVGTVCWFIVDNWSTDLWSNPERLPAWLHISILGICLVGLALFWLPFIGWTLVAGRRAT